MPALFKNRTENNHNGEMVGQKKLIQNSYGGNNTPAKVLCCQNPLKTVSDAELDFKIPNQVHQERQMPC